MHPLYGLSGCLFRPPPVGRGQTAEMRTLCHSGAILVPPESPEGDFDFLVECDTCSLLSVTLPRECVLPPAQDKTAHGTRRGQPARNACAGHLHTGTPCSTQGKRGEMAAQLLSLSRSINSRPESSSSFFSPFCSSAASGSVIVGPLCSPLTRCFCPGVSKWL